MSDCDSVCVSTKYGIVEGRTHVLPSGKKYDTFLGIPYAEPPVGRLRFEKPERIRPWPDIFQAVDYSANSYPLTGWPLDPNQSEVTSENCLSLNIFRPHDVTVSQPRPVLIYCHGGGYCSGYSRQYGHRQWSENFVASEHNFIFVTIQYRLGIFGFLSDGSSELPGNYGLWDQASATQFINEIISSFGGNPNRIIIWGLSAGAGSSAALVFSPHSKAFIHASIEMSGTLGAAWSYSKQTVQAGREFVTAFVAQSGESANAAKQLLKSLTVDKIQQVAHEIVIRNGAGRFAIDLLSFHPHIDNDFLSYNSIFSENDLRLNLLPQQISRSVLMGLTASEALYFTLLGKDEYLNKIGIPIDQINSFNRFQFRDRVQVIIQNSDGFPRQHLNSVLQDICDFYIGDTVNLESSFCFKAYTKLFSDVLFNVPTVRMARARARNGIQCYLYMNSYYNSLQYAEFDREKLFGHLYDATHGNEYPYINGIFPVGKFEFNEIDEIHRKILVDIVSSFTENGYPSVDQMTEAWPPISSDSLAPIRILRLKADTSLPYIDDAPELETAADFWRNLADKFDFDLVSNERRPVVQ